MKLSLVVAMSWNGEIGRDGKLPWGRIPEDMALFRELTMGHSIILGRKTWGSLGYRPLKHRKHVILSKTLDPESTNVYHVDNPVYVVRTPAEAIVEAFNMNQRQGATAFVIGGAEVYRLLAPLCGEAHVTTARGYYRGDTYFPFCFSNNPEWELVETKDLRDGVDYRRYTRRH